jgi:hypothetical protein
MAVMLSTVRHSRIALQGKIGTGMPFAGAGEFTDAFSWLAGTQLISGYF